VAEMITDMKVAIEAARALTYETSRVCDLENSNLRALETGQVTDKTELKRRKERSRTLKRLNGMLTPMSKYYASEVCVAVANTALQVLGGSGYMTDYPAERYLRDARITTIYEGTSQLQIVAAVRGVCSGAFERRVIELEEAGYDDSLLKELQHKLRDAKAELMEAIAYVKQRGTDYMDLAGRRLVDSAAAILIGHLLLGQATRNERKRRVARRFIDSEAPRIHMNCELARSGDAAPLDEYDLLAGPVPAQD
jgi:alkylation response protein AidB-like acyl-CoA dehydrogenase